MMPLDLESLQKLTEHFLRDGFSYAFRLVHDDFGFDLDAAIVIFYEALIAVIALTSLKTCGITFDNCI